MAAIAKFISFDGGIAFSDSVVKFQKRSSDGKLYRILFEPEQYSQALSFKKQLDEYLAPGEEPADEPVPAEPDDAPAPKRRAVSRAPSDDRRRPRGGKGGGAAALLRKWWFWVAVVALIAAVVIAVVALTGGSGQNEADPSGQENGPALTIPAPVNPAGTPGQAGSPAGYVTE